VCGCDVNPDVVKKINQKILPFSELGLQELLESSDIQASLQPIPSDVFLVCVPTPFDKDIKMANLKCVIDALESVVPVLRKGNMIIIESTVTPGTCEKIAIPIIEKTGLKVGTDIDLVHCPERAMPGQTIHEMIHNDRVIGGIDKKSADRAGTIYRSFVKGKLYFTDIRTAEFVKLMENTYRDVNIALANEFAILSEEMGINVWEAINLANRHPRVNILSPGPGVGGHCIAVDPWFLTESSVHALLITTAREINDNMPSFVFSRLKKIISSESIPNPVITLFGVAYKGNIGDTRETPALKFIRLCERENWQVRICDPHVKSFHYPILDVEKATEGSDCIVLLTDHSEFKAINPSSLEMRHKIIFDTRNIIERDLWEKAGFLVRILGSGDE
jgi:UDP-N-acetyl-D-mannosaminuronic acid dehydrogenase